jgi:hypothetical protein
MRSHSILPHLLRGLAALATVGVVSLPAQQPAGGARLASRAELVALAQTLERAAESPAYGARLRASARLDLGRVRRRLGAGDFTVGERIFVRVEGGERPFADTVSIRDSLIVDLPNIRRFSVTGVLRSELEAHLTNEVRAVIRNARVTSQPLMRVAVLGAVTTPGFRAVPSETLVDHLLFLGGSPTATATLDKMRFMRGDTVLLTGPAVMAAIAQGRTLASLDLADGDALVVPSGSPPWDRSSALQIVSLLMAPLIAVVLAR